MPGPNPSIGDNPENVLYKTWKEADEVARPEIIQAMLPLLRRHASKVCWMVLHCYNPTLVEDIATDALLDLEKFEERSLFSTWFHTRALFRCRSEVRTIRRRKEVPFETSAAGGKHGTPASQEFAAELFSVANTLTDREQRLLSLKMEEGYTHQQIADELQLNTVYVRQLWSRLRKRLRLLYGGKVA